MRDLKVLFPGTDIQSAVEKKPRKQYQERNQGKHTSQVPFPAHPYILDEQEAKSETEDGYPPENEPLFFGEHSKCYTGSC